MSKKAIIIGAGPAGLTTAYTLLKETDIKPIIIEELDCVGGIARTVFYNGNGIDLGGHRLFSKSQTILDLWEELMPLQGKPPIDDKILGRSITVSENGPDPDEADIVIAHKNFAKGGAKILSTANEYRLQVFYIKTNSMAQIQKVLKDALQISSSESLQGYYDDAERALDEAKAAINKILAGANNIELQPQNQQIRKLQHELVEQHNLVSKSVGEGDERHLRIVGGQDFEQ
jgi:uncharacterized protein with NAD-binding domain and iron-sulfur cluster